MSKSSHIVAGLIGLAIGINTANCISYLSKPHSNNSSENTNQLSTLENCVVQGVVTDSNIPLLDRERIKMRASGLYPIKIGLSVNDGPNKGKYEIIVEGFTNPENGSPKSTELKLSYQDLFDVYCSGPGTGDIASIPCGLFDSLSTNQYPLPRITKLP